MVYFWGYIVASQAYLESAISIPSLALTSFANNDVEICQDANLVVVFWAPSYVVSPLLLVFVSRIYQYLRSIWL